MRLFYTICPNYGCSEIFKKLSPKAKAAQLSPPARKVVDKALEVLATLIPEQAQLAQQAAPDTDALRDKTKSIDDTLDVLAAALAGDELQKEAARALRDLGQLRDAVAAKRADAIPSLLLHATAVLSEPPSKLLPLARRVAHATQDPDTKQRLVSAIGDADGAFPAIAENLREALSDPREALAGDDAGAPLRDLDVAKQIVERIAGLGAAASPVEESVAVASKTSDALGTPYSPLPPFLLG